MSEQSERNVRQALYMATLNKLNGELSELEAKEVLLTNNPSYITSKDHDHADHIEELKNILVKQCELKDTIDFLKNTHFKPQEAAKNDGKNS